MRYFKTNKIELSVEDLQRFIAMHRQKTQRYKMLLDAYLGKLNTKDKEYIHNAYPKYITDVLVGYFVGNPITYSSQNTKLLEKIQDVFNYSDEQEENFEIAKLCSIFGIGNELLYHDEDGQIRFKEISPMDSFTIHDSSIENNMKWAIRYYKIDKEYEIVVMDKEKTIFYTSENLTTFKFKEEQNHYFGDVPFVVYENNKELQGDFEQVISSVKSYNVTQTNTFKDMALFTDSYLALSGMQGTDTKDIEKASTDRVLLLSEQGKAEFLVKNVNDSWVENYKRRLKEDIHKFSFTPDMTDESFGNAPSGVSLEYKLLGMEQLRKVKERKFKKGLQRRIELITNALSITNDIDLFTDLEINFTNTLPKNILEISQIIGNLTSFASKQTLMSQIPFIDDIHAEMELKEEEDKQDNYFDDDYENTDEEKEKNKHKKLKKDR